MRASVESLVNVNPGCDYYPPDYNQAAYEQLRVRLQRLTRDSSAEFGEQFRLSDPTWIQDATYGAEIYLPDSLVVGDGQVSPCIRASNHGGFFIITVIRRLRPGAELRIENVAEGLGFTYTPEALFGAAFDLRERFNGDLFNQLYDYV